jgi:hypothetical protein
MGARAQGAQVPPFMYSSLQKRAPSEGGGITPQPGTAKLRSHPVVGPRSRDASARRDPRRVGDGMLHFDRLSGKPSHYFAPAASGRLSAVRGSYGSAGD